MDTPKLIKFYGQECHFCHLMDPIDQKLESDLGVHLEKLEVWHNRENAQLLKSVDTMCGGVPFYVNTETGRVLCGAVDYETLKVWAQGKPAPQPMHTHSNDEHDLYHHKR